MCGLLLTTTPSPGTDPGPDVSTPGSFDTLRPQSVRSGDPGKTRLRQVVTHYGRGVTPETSVDSLLRDVLSYLCRAAPTGVESTERSFRVEVSAAGGGYERHFCPRSTLPVTPFSDVGDPVVGEGRFLSRVTKCRVSEGTLKGVDTRSGVPFPVLTRGGPNTEEYSNRRRLSFSLLGAILHRTPPYICDEWTRLYPDKEGWGPTSQ